MVDVVLGDGSRIDYLASQARVRRDGKTWGPCVRSNIAATAKKTHSLSKREEGYQKVDSITKYYTNHTVDLLLVAGFQ